MDGIFEVASLDGVTVILPETTLSGFQQDMTGLYGVFDGPSPFVLNPGEEYRVVWDGVEYPVTSVFLEDYGYVYVGNGEDAGFPGNGEPFCLLYSPADGEFPDSISYYAVRDYNQPHTIAIYQGEASGGEDHPDETAILPVGSQEFFPSANDAGEIVYTTTFLEFTLEPGRKYRVSWDGEETVLMAYPDPNGEVCLGNLFIAGAEENTGERFLIVYGDGYSNIATYEAGESREVAIWLINDAGIILLDYKDEPTAYYGREVLEVPSTVEGESVNYVREDLVPETVEKTVELDFSGGDMTVTPEAGQAFSKVNIPVPEGLAPENIPEGMTIAGIVGAMVAGGADLAIKSGRITGSGAALTIQHGLGMVPDIVIFLTNNDVAAPSTNYLKFVVGFSSAFCTKIGSSNCIFYGGKKTDGTSIATAPTNMSIEQNAYALSNTNENQFTVGWSTYVPYNGFPYVWYAIGGLT